MKKSLFEITKKQHPNYCVSFLIALVATFAFFIETLQSNFEEIHAQEGNLSKIPYKLPPDFSGLLIFQSDVDGDEELYLLSRKGLKKLTNNSYPDQYPQFSPDGNMVVYHAKPQNEWKLFLLDLKTSEIDELIHKEGNFRNPCWSPNGKAIAFDTDIWGNVELGIFDMSSKVITRLTNKPGFNGLPDWSPDGKSIAFAANRGQGYKVFILNLETKIEMFLTEGGNCRPDWSPDGKWIAYVSDNGKKYDIFLVRPDGTDRHQLANDPIEAEYDPNWSKDGKRIYFHKSTGRGGRKYPYHIWVINSDGTCSFQITRGESTNLFPDSY